MLDQTPERLSSASRDSAAGEAASPLVTLILLAYQQEKFISEALDAALAQTYSPLQIIVHDDSSVDRTFDILQDIVESYVGPHRVLAVRSRTNLGFAGSINAVMELAQGELIVAASGDDRSRPDRVSQIVAAYESGGRRDRSLFSAAVIIDEQGQREGDYPLAVSELRFSPEYIVRHQSGVLGATHAWHRDCFDRFGPLGATIIREDVAIPFRSSLLGTVRYIEAPLVEYRVHGANLHFNRTFDRDPAGLYKGLRLATSINVDLCRSFLADIQQAEILGILTGDRAALLRRLASAALSETVLELELLDAGPVARLRLFGIAIRRKTRPLRLLRWTFVCYCPTLYVQLLHFAFRRDILRLADGLMSTLRRRIIRSQPS